MSERSGSASALRLGSLGLFALTFGTACTAGSSGVTRMSEGIRYEGRFINPEAYAAYLLGVEREARGDYRGALAGYLEAHAEDPDSPEIWARMGAVRCFSSPAEAGPVTARATFERGVEQDPEYYANYLERARCSARALDFQHALSDALGAVARRPDDEPANLLVAHLLQALGRPGEARAWLEALQSYRQPPSLAVERALDGARSAWSRQPPPRHARAVAIPGAPAPAPAPTTGAASSAFSELRAGRAERARVQAQIAFDADPSNADAWIATLVACDALRDEACFEHTLSGLKSPSVAPSTTALGYLRELVARRTGSEAMF